MLDIMITNVEDLTGASETEEDGIHEAAEGMKAGVPAAEAPESLTEQVTAAALESGAENAAKVETMEQGGKASRDSLEQMAKRAKTSAKSLGSTVAGTLGRKLGKTVGSTFGDFGETLGGNIGASVGRGIVNTLFKA